MSRSERASTVARRDAGLRRLRTLNRVLIGAAVAGTGLLTDVAAHAFPGHKRVVRTTTPATSDSVPATSATHRRANRRQHRDHPRHHTHPVLQPPAHAPTTVTQSATHTTATQAAPTPAPAVTTSAPQPAAPAPAPTPAPVVSGGS
jgi:hypothetical protein